jgi:hypothetical protein
MIAMIQPLAAGNALRVILDVPAGASKCRLLRKVSDTFAGQDDPDALLVSDALERAALDTAGLVNSTLYFYRAYYFVAGVWVTGAAVSATPAATYEDRFGDVMSLVRERIDLGLQVEVQRGTLVHDQGHIKVLTAPPIFDDTVWPVVTVHLAGEAPAERAVGEMPFPDEFDEGSNQWAESEGWLARVQITIMGWSDNPDERIELRKALRRTVLANMPIFDFAGMVSIEFSQQDTEDFASWTIPVYQTLGTFSCMAPVVVGSNVGAINEVHTTIVE